MGAGRRPDETLSSQQFDFSRATKMTRLNYAIMKINKCASDFRFYQIFGFLTYACSTESLNSRSDL